jgi:hypothetical protein
MKLNPVKTQYERDEQEYYANRSKYRHIKPFANNWKVWASSVYPTLAEALAARGKV